jgi:formylglycine-generating enzyme
VDEVRRELERRVNAGDYTALPALERIWIQAGLGWHGELLPKGLSVAPERGVYNWLLPERGFALELVYVPAGEFCMGSDMQQGAQTSHHPRHRHRVSGDFWIGRFPITWREYRGFCEVLGRQLPEEPRWGIFDDHPVVNVSWEDSVAFCRYAGVDLPREPEWEYAARGRDDDRDYPWGNEPPTLERCAFQLKTTVGVREKMAGASPFGAVQMSGNVWEWCKDFYDASYPRYARCDFSPPPVPPEGRNQGRVLRGGCYGSGPRHVTVWRRYQGEEYNGWEERGFRIVIRRSSDPL